VARQTPGYLLSEPERRSQVRSGLGDGQILDALL